MGTSWRRTSATLVSVCAAGAVAISAQAPPLLSRDPVPTIEELVAAQDFQHRVDRYITLHRMLEAPLTPLRPTMNMSDVQRTRDALATGIRGARSNAAQGDVIDPDTARFFKRRIASCLSPEAWFAILAELDENEDGSPVPVVPLKVNMSWPAGVPYGFVPLQLLTALPPLPPELQYRIIGRSLVLWDDHADLIVDFLPGAFASAT